MHNSHFTIKKSALHPIYYLLSLCIIHCALCIQCSAQLADYKDSNEGDTVIVGHKSYIVHKCKKDETIFTIAAAYHVSVNDLDESNKDVINNLKKNTILLIPIAVQKQEKVKKVDEAIVLPRHTLYNIALLIPFNENRNYTVDSTLAAGFVLNDDLEKETVSSLEFYEGILVALDSLKMLGLKAKVHVIDAFDSVSVSKALLKPEVKAADLLITNMGPTLFSLLGTYSKGGKPVVISCATNASVSSKKDTSSFYTTPSSLKQCYQMGRHYHSISKAKDQVFIIKTAVNKEMERAEAFRQGLAAEGKDSGVVMVDAAKLSSIGSSMVKGKNNVVFLPSTDEAYVSDVINILKAQQAKFDITLIGLPTWQYFQSVSPDDLKLLRTQLFLAIYIDYESPATMAFRKCFRDKYATEPSEHAFTGYDAMFFFGEELLKYGLNFTTQMNDKQYTGLSTNFHFVKQGGANGHENSYISVLQFEVYSLRKVNK